MANGFGLFTELPEAYLTELQRITAGISTIPADIVNSTNTDAFKRLRVVEPAVVFASTATNTMQRRHWQSKASGSDNTVSYTATRGCVALTLGGTASGYCVYQTLQYVTYQPGRSQFISMTGNMNADVAGLTQRIGFFDAENGAFFQQASGLSVVIRSSATGQIEDLVIEQADWNLDTLDGSGDSGNPSGIAIDFSQMQLWIIDFGWQGAASVRFGLFVDGEIRYCHIHHCANHSAYPWSRTGSLPVRYELSCSSPIAATMNMVCVAVASEGGYFSAPGAIFSGGRNLTGISLSATEVPLVAIRPMATFGGRPNRTSIEPKAVNVTMSGGTTGLWRLLYCPPGSAIPITGGSWVAADTDSAVEINVSATAVTTTGLTEIDSEFIANVANGRTVEDSSVAAAYPLTLDICGSNSPLDSNVGANPGCLILVMAGSGSQPVGSGRIQWSEIQI